MIDNPITVSPDQYLLELEELRPFIQQLFSELSTKISPYNPCSLYITGFSPYNYAEFKKPSLIVVYLGSIINNLQGKSMGLKKASLAMCVIHELFHANQNTNMMRYGSDQEYSDIIEAQAQNSTIEYLKHNRDYFINRFGIDPYQYLKLNTIASTPYEQLIPEEYFLNTIVDVFYRNSGVRGALKNLLDDPQYPDIAIQFDEQNPVWIKKNNIYDLEVIPAFNQSISQYRAGIFVFCFRVDTKLIKRYPKNPNENPSMIIHFKTRDRTCRPVELTME